jgi:hypothetical protein
VPYISKARPTPRGYLPLFLDGLTIWNTRTHPATLEQIFQFSRDGGFGFVVLDPLYKLLSGNELDQERVKADIALLDGFAVLMLRER